MEVLLKFYKKNVNVRKGSYFCFKRLRNQVIKVKKSLRSVFHEQVEKSKTLHKEETRNCQVLHRETWANYFEYIWWLGFSFRIINRHRVDSLDKLFDSMRVNHHDVILQIKSEVSHKKR